MASIVAKWIEQTISVKVDAKFENLASLIRNGHILTRLLLAYRVITKKEAEFVLQTNPQDDTKIEENFQGYLKPWLERIKINLTDTDITSILKGQKYETALRLFQIYLALKTQPQKQEDNCHSHGGCIRLDSLLENCSVVLDGLRDCNKEDSNKIDHLKQQITEMQEGMDDTTLNKFQGSKTTQI